MFFLFFRFCFAFCFYYYFDIFFDDAYGGAVERIFGIFFDDVTGGAAMELFSVSSSYNNIFIANDVRQILSSVVTEIPPVL